MPPTCNPGAALLHQPSVEVNVVEHCNLRCYACDHAAPLSARRFASLEQFEADLGVLAGALRTDELRILGGEPLLHPRLPDFLEAARRSGVARKIVVVTNGLLLPRMPEAFWSRLDRVWLSIYPGVQREKLAEETAALCGKHGVELHLDLKRHFYLTQLNDRIESAWLVEAIFRHCKSAHEWSCHTVHEGRYYKCPTAALLASRLRARGVTFEPAPGDSVSLNAPGLAERLAAHLADERPLEACRWCLGTSGPAVPTRQLDHEGLTRWGREDHRALISEVAASMAKDPGQRAASPPPGPPPLRAPRPTWTPWLDEASSRSQSLVELARENCWLDQLGSPRQTLRQALAFAVHRSPGRQASSQQDPLLPAGANYRAALEWTRAPGRALAETGELAGLIPTLLDCGERGAAIELARRLCVLQRADGSWQLAEDGRLLSTARALAGLLAFSPLPGELESAVRLGLGWLPHAGVAERRGRWSVRLAGRAEQMARLWARVASSRGKRLGHLDFGALPSDPFPTLAPSPPWAHAHAEAPGLLLELGEAAAVRAWATRQEELQRPDGSLPAFPGAGWTCSTCTALTSTLWCSLGRLAPARRALGYLSSRQEGGALRGSYGPGASFRPGEATLSGAKAFLDAFHAFVRLSFDEQENHFADQVEPGDGRLSFLVRELGGLNARKVLDAGCGRGPVMRELMARFPAVELWGVDHSEAMLRHLPEGAHRRRGSIQNLPFEDGLFDLTYCAEALEHAGNPAGAVAELCRVTRPGGQVIIIDKSLARAGALAIEPWEQWFRRGDVEAWLRAACQEVQSETLVHAPDLGPDLFVAWQGRRC